MIIQPHLPSGYVVFCDDIRDEVNGKKTIVGSYSGEMTVYGDQPLRVGQLCAWIVYRDDHSTFPKQVTIKVIKESSQKEELMFEANIDLPAPPPELELSPLSDSDSIRFSELHAFPRFAGIDFPEECRIKVRAYVGDDEIRLGALNVKIARPESAPDQSN